MPYIDLAGLSRYASRQKERLERDYALLRDMQWLRTEKAGAVSLWPVGGTPLKPSVDFLFAETPPASGDKGPDNPSTITGVSSVKTVKCGKNLFAFPKNYSKTLSNGVTISVDSDGFITLNGTATANGYDVVVLTAPLVVAPGISITISNTFISGTQTLNQDDLSFKTQLQLKTVPASSSYWVAASKFETATYTMQIERYVSTCQIYIYSGAVFNNLKFKTQAEFGAASTDFEPYSGDTYTLDLGNTFYGGTLDVASGVMTVTHVAYDIGEATTSYASTQLLFNFDAPALDTSFTPVSDSFVFHAAAFADLANGDFRYQIVSDTVTRWLFKATDYSTVEAFQEAFAGRKLVYKLAAPTTVQLTPVQISALAQQDKYTPRLNTVYTDAQAVQVGYVKSPIRDEYELTQAITAQGGNV